VTFLSLIFGRCVAVPPLFSRCSIAVFSLLISLFFDRNRTNSTAYEDCEFFRRESARGAACWREKCHCEEWCDEAISMIRRKRREMASLRSQ
jgi:hypothetical protein